MRANYENLKLIPARVLYSCVKMSISLRVCADRPCSHPPLCTRARARARAAARACLCASSGVCVSLGTHASDRSIDLFTITSVNTAPVLRMRGGVRRCLAHACQRARVRGADGTAALRACEYGSLSSQPWTGTHRWVGIHIQYIHTPCPVRLSSYARIAEADMRHVRAQACVRARARVCAWARPHPCRRVRALPAAAEPHGLGWQAFSSASAFNANIGAWNTARVASLSKVCAASGPARTTADCAWSVVDACAVVVRGGAADVRVRM